MVALAEKYSRKAYTPQKRTTRNVRRPKNAYRDFFLQSQNRGPATKNRILSSKYLDEELEWYYYVYRYYDPELGRWPSRDPIEEKGGMNLYAYVSGNPLGMVDFLGMNPVDISHSLSLTAYDFTQTAGYNGDSGTFNFGVNTSVEGKNLTDVPNSKYEVIVRMKWTDSQADRVAALSALGWPTGLATEPLESLLEYYTGNVMPSTPWMMSYDDFAAVYVEDAADFTSYAYTKDWESDGSNSKAKSKPVPMPIGECPKSGKAAVWLFHADLSYFKGHSWAKYTFEWQYNDDQTFTLTGGAISHVGNPLVPDRISDQFTQSMKVWEMTYP